MFFYNHDPGHGQLFHVFDLGYQGTLQSQPCSTKERLPFVLAHASFSKEPGDDTHQKHDHNRRSFVQVSHNPHGSIIVRIIILSGRTFGALIVLMVVALAIIIVIVVVSVGIIGWLDIHVESGNE